MWRRGLICLAIVIGVCLAGVAFLPAGAGPYTAVYGPASTLRAQRAVLLLALAISFLAAVIAVAAAPRSSQCESFDPFVPLVDLFSSAPLIFSLRC